MNVNLMEDVVRVLRVLEYVGNREWVESSLSRRGVKGTHTMPNGCQIREAIIGETPSILSSEELPVLRQPRGFGLRAQGEGEFAVSQKPTWDCWVSNQLTAVHMQFEGKMIDQDTADRMIALLEEVRTFANMP